MSGDDPDYDIGYDSLPVVPQERAALVAWLLADGGHLTTATVAELCGTTPEAARIMLNNISRVLPIVRMAALNSCEGGTWQRVGNKKEPGG